MSSFPLISKGTETLSCQRFLSHRLSSTFQAEQEQAFSASHFPLQRALNLGMEKIFFFIFSSAVGERVLRAVGSEKVMLISYIQCFIRRQRERWEADWKEYKAQ